MTSNRLPSLSVDMRLSLEDDEEEPIRMPRTSKTRRHRYALDDDSDDDDDQYGTSRTAYGRQESFQQSQESCEKFVLPEQDDSSSESESDEDETVLAPRVVTHSPQANNSQSIYQFHNTADDDEDYLFEASFLAPETRSSTTQQDKEFFDEHDMYLNQPSPQQEEHEVVDLCASDDDGLRDDEFASSHNTVTYRQGVRTAHKSPRFNANSRRDFFSPNNGGRPFQAMPESPVLPVTTLEDDVVESWSSEDEGNRKPRARRVTNPYERHQPSVATHSTGSWHSRERQVADLKNRDSSIFDDVNRGFGATSLNVASHPSAPVFDNNMDDNEQVFVPAPSRAKRQDSFNRFKAERLDRRRRLRDATASQNTAAAVVIRNAPFEQASSTVWYRQGAALPPPPASLRNDLAGGSGVGAGNYTYNVRQSEQADGASASSSKGRKKKSTKRATKAGGGRKKKWGGGKKSYYKKKGGGKGKSGGATTNRNNNWSNARTSRGSNEEYSRQDPILKHVGGANIIF